MWLLQAAYGSRGQSGNHPTQFGSSGPQEIGFVISSSTQANRNNLGILISLNNAT